MLSYSDFSAYVKKHAGSSRLWLAIEMIDSGGNSHYFTDRGGAVQSSTYNYLPVDIVIGTPLFEASLFTGSYSVRPVRVIMSNTLEPNGFGSSTRFSDKFADVEFETEVCTIHLGWGDETDSTKWPPFLKGRMTDFVQTNTTIEFTLIPRGAVELPSIPENKFTRTNFPGIPEDLEGAPIPLVYGEWTLNISDSTRYNNHRSLIPAPLVDDKKDLASPTMEFRLADHAVQTIGRLWIYDKILRSFGEIQDTTTETVADAKIVLDIGSSTDNFFLEAEYELYPTRVEVGGAVTVEEAEKALSWSYNDDATLEHGDSLTLRLDDAIGQLDAEDLSHYVGPGAVNQSVGLHSVHLRLGLYTDNTFVTGQTFTVSIENSNWEEVLTASEVNALVDGDFFNQTWTSASHLKTTHGELWSGATPAFKVQQTDVSGTNDHPAYDIIPDAGFYSTMAELAEMLTQKLLELKEDASTGTDFQKEWICVYDKDKNKMRIESAGSGGDHIRVFGDGTTKAADLGFTETAFHATAPAGQDTGDQYEAQDPTVLDVPDGDFSRLVIKVENGGTSGPSCEFKGVYVGLTRRYRSFDPFDQAATEQIDKVRELRQGQFVGRRNRDNKLELLFKDTNRVKTFKTLRDALSANIFFANLGGARSVTTGLYESGGEIIEDILTNQISTVAAADVDTTSLGNAHTDGQIQNMHMYLATQERAEDVLAAIARYSLGFFFESQDAKYKMTVLKSSYAESDIDLTIEPEDVPGPISRSVRFYRTANDELAKDLTLQFMPNFVTGGYHETIVKDSGSSLSIKPKEMICLNTMHYDDAEIIANHFSGDSAAGTTGHFGEPKIHVELPVIHPEAHLVELGDIIRLSTRWPAYKCFGIPYSSAMFKVLSKRYDQREVTFTGVEVRRLLGPHGEYLPDEAAGDTFLLYDFGRMANEGQTGNNISGLFADYPAAAKIGPASDSINSTEFRTGVAYTMTDGGDGGGPASGIHWGGGGGGNSTLRYDNDNTDPLHAYMSPGLNAFYFSIWVNDLDDAGGSQGAMLAGAPYDNAPDGEKWEFSLTNSGFLNIFLDDGTNEDTLLATTSIVRPFTGQVFFYYNPDTILAVGANGVVLGSKTPNTSLGEVMGGTSFLRRFFLFNRNSGAQLGNPDETSIFNQVRFYSIDPSRFPSDPEATIAKFNFDVLNGTI